MAVLSQSAVRILIPAQQQKTDNKVRERQFTKPHLKYCTVVFVWNDNLEDLKSWI